MQLKLQNETQVWAYVLLLSWTLSKEMRTVSAVEPASLGFLFGGGGVSETDFCLYFGFSWSAIPPLLHE